MLPENLIHDREVRLGYALNLLRVQVFKAHLPVQEIMS